MDELLSLKWKNHCSTFLHILKLIRKEQLYTDVTLACEGKYYKVHRMVLTACSTYFQEIFEQTENMKPIIILNGIKYEDLERILDYMYIGEVNIEQSDLSSLIKAAEYLQIKGLAIADEEPSSKKYLSKDDVRNSGKRKSSDIINPTSAPHKVIKKNKKNLHDLDNTTPKEELIGDMVFKTEKIDNEPSIETIFIEQENIDSKIDITKEDILNSPGISGHNSSETNEINNGEFQDLATNGKGNDNNSNSIMEHVSDPLASTSKQSFRRIPCNICDKVFTTAYKIRRHMLIHTGEKPFSCSLCPHQSNDKTNLKRHMICVHRTSEMSNPLSS